MHYHCEVWLPELPEGKTIEELISAEMGPFQEQFCDNQNCAGDCNGCKGWWDWWVVGGRWTGSHDGYEPHKDPANYSPCRYCAGTGHRPGSPFLAVDGTLGCNVCNNEYSHEYPGQEYNFTLQPHAGDIISINQLPDGFTCYRLVAGERQWVTEQYNPDAPPGEAFETIWDGNVKAILSNAKGFLVTVDYHC